MNQYPHLRNLLGAYLNMDVDTIAGTDDPDEIINYYILDAPKPVLEQLVSELDHFEQNYSKSLDEIFGKTFSPEMDIPDVHSFFCDLKMAIRRYLSQL